ncbi:MAG: caspase family protein [Alphaproteobacteria bacterium]|nr:caspase family protein [Alphaproteobacteria bacterium]MCB9698868.1 caspase family protein [Alphaproteobacteria bacterium]
MIVAALALGAHAAPLRMAVLVGSNQGRGAEADLLYAERDAERMAEVLTELGGFDAEDVVLLRSPGAERVTDVLEEMGRRASWARSQGDEAMLLVYYSGHADAGALHLGTTDLPLPAFKRAVERVDADVRLMLVDACQSGELTRLKGASQVEPFTIHAEDRIDSEGLVIITASSPGEDAQESDRLEGGVFTHHLLAGLVGAADSSGDGAVTLTEAFRYGYEGTLRSTSSAPVVQHPSYAFDLRGSDDLVLTRLDGAQRAARLTFADGGTWVLLPRDARAEILEVTVPPGGSVAVAPGEWTVRRREPEALLEGRVDLERGGSATVSRAELDPVPYGTTVRRGLDEGRHAALALSAGLGVVGPTLPELPSSPELVVGGRMDLEPVSLLLRVHGGHVRHVNEALTLDQDRAGVDLGAVKWMDVGRFAPGVGVQVGADLVRQRYQTAGTAPDHVGAVGRIGPWLGAELLASGRTSLSLGGGVDVALYRELDGGFTAQPVPHGSLQGVVYVR